MYYWNKGYSKNHQPKIFINWKTALTAWRKIGLHDDYFISSIKNKQELKWGRLDRRSKHPIVLGMD